MREAFQAFPDLREADTSCGSLTHANASRLSPRGEQAGCARRRTDAGRLHAPERRHVADYSQWTKGLSRQDAALRAFGCPERTSSGLALAMLLVAPGLPLAWPAIPLGALFAGSETSADVVYGQ